MQLTRSTLPHGPPQAKQLLHQSGGDAVSILAHALDTAPAARLHARMGPLMEVAEQLGACSESQQSQVCAPGILFNNLRLALVSAN